MCSKVKTNEHNKWKDWEIPNRKIREEYQIKMLEIRSRILEKKKFTRHLYCKNEHWKTKINEHGNNSNRN